MKATLLLLLGALLVLMVVYRQRIYVRDPLATVYRSYLPQSSAGGQHQNMGDTSHGAALGDSSNSLQNGDKEGKQSGVQVFINPSGDVLLEQDATPGAYQILLQAWNKQPGTPTRLTCVHWVVCLMEAEHPTTYPLARTSDHSATRPMHLGNKDKEKYDPHVSMTDREVSFVDGTGATMRVVLR